MDTNLEKEYGRFILFLKKSEMLKVVYFFCIEIKALFYLAMKKSF